MACAFFFARKEVCFITIQPAQSDCGRDYSQRIDLCLNEGDEVVDCELIIV